MTNNKAKSELIDCWDTLYFDVYRKLCGIYEDADVLVGDATVTSLNQCKNLLESISFILKHRCEPCQKEIIK